MIGSIHGILIHKTPNLVLIDCNGVGYEIVISLSTYDRLPEIGKRVFLFTHARILPESQTLYGFANAMEKNLFLELIKLNKIGPRIALAVLGMYDVSEIFRILKNRGSRELSKVPGIGPATAERMVVELAPKLDTLTELLVNGRKQTKNLSAVYHKLVSSSVTAVATSSEVGVIVAENSAITTADFSSDLTADFSDDSEEYGVKSNALHALVNLGIKDSEAKQIIEKVYEEGMTTELIVREALLFYKKGKK